MRRLGIQLSMLAATLNLGTCALRAQVFFNGSDAYDIAQYNWDGHLRRRSHHG